MGSYENFKKELLSDPSAKKGYENYRSSIMTGDLVRKWRTDAKLTQVQLADAIGTSQEAISKIESVAGIRGPHVGTLTAIANACGRDLEIRAEKRVAEQTASEQILDRNLIHVSIVDQNTGEAENDLNQLQARLAKLYTSKDKPRFLHVAGITGMLTELLIPAVAPAVSTAVLKELTEWIHEKNRLVRIKSEQTVTESGGKDKKTILRDLYLVYRNSSGVSVNVAADEV